MAKLKIGIMGAGAIGGYLGIRMSAAGYPVTLIGRASLFKDKLAATNLKKDTAVPGPDLKIALTPDALAEVDVCLLTVKSRSTLESAAQLQAVLPGKNTGHIVSKRHSKRVPHTKCRPKPTRVCRHGHFQCGAHRAGIAKGHEWSDHDE
jgi:glycerol-3-phosphate dehydrogenase